MVNYGKGRTDAQCTAKGIPSKYAQPKLNNVTLYLKILNVFITIILYMGKVLFMKYN